jgi:hypothetical protein
MQRVISGTGSYTFNNAQTQVTFTAGTLPTTMTLAVFPQTDPNNYDPTKDVRRKVTVSWSGSSNWTATFRVGYKTSDIPTTWVSSVNQSNLRFYESPTNWNSGEGLDGEHVQPFGCFGSEPGLYRAGGDSGDWNGGAQRASAPLPRGTTSCCAAVRACSTQFAPGAGRTPTPGMRA